MIYESEVQPGCNLRYVDEAVVRSVLVHANQSSARGIGILHLQFMHLQDAIGIM